jgi:retron-type reverse transcriptase
MTDSTKPDLKPVTAWRRMPMDPAVSEDLRERVLTPENLRKAWRQVKTNHGAPGVDGMTIEDFPAFARAPWPGIRQALRDERYQPSPVRRTEIPKRHGQGKRLLGIPMVPSYCTSIRGDLGITVVGEWTNQSNRVDTLA